ncbi:MAG: hypothetical protein MUC65_03480, partial [Pontiellaceae bacterium]|nr:hypothetical protein [Pontiellaceae bacterium]
MRKITGFLFICLALPLGLSVRSEPEKKQPVLYLVGYSHLDTQWNWTYVTTINEFLPATLNENFERFEKYPGYIFNFSGANRYRMIKEYYPADYGKMKE